MIILGMADHEPSNIYSSYIHCNRMIYPVIAAFILHLIHWIPYNLTMAHIKLMIHTMDYYSTVFEVLPPFSSFGTTLRLFKLLMKPS